MSGRFANPLSEGFYGRRRASLEKKCFTVLKPRRTEGRTKTKLVLVGWAIAYRTEKGLEQCSINRQKMGAKGISFLETSPSENGPISSPKACASDSMPVVQSTESSPVPSVTSPSPATSASPMAAPGEASTKLLRFLYFAGSGGISFLETRVHRFSTRVLNQLRFVTPFLLRSDLHQGHQHLPRLRAPKGGLRCSGLRRSIVVCRGGCRTRSGKCRRRLHETLISEYAYRRLGFFGILLARMENIVLWFRYMYRIS
jgi:hypothetical protein